MAVDAYLEEPPRLSADESMVYLKNAAMRAETGELLSIDVASPEDAIFLDPAYFTGAEGGNYYRLGHQIIGWRSAESDLEVDPALTWAYQSFVAMLPEEMGMTPASLAWMYYTTSWADARMVWLDSQSRVVGNYRFPYPGAKLIALGQNDEAYLCGSTGARVICINIPPGTDTPVWTSYIDNRAQVLGGALVPGRIYIALAGDGLYALGTNKTGAP
jgi:hypothetical protein